MNGMAIKLSRLNELSVRKLKEEISNIDDIEELKEALKNEKRNSAKEIIKRRIRQLEEKEVKEGKKEEIHKPVKEIDYWMIATMILLIALAITVAFAFHGSSIKEKNIVEANYAGQKAVNYISTNMNVPEQLSLNVINVSDVNWTDDLYKVMVDIEYQGRTINQVPVYVTKDGKNLCLLYTSPSPRDLSTTRMPSSA